MEFDHDGSSVRRSVNVFRATGAIGVLIMVGYGAWSLADAKVAVAVVAFLAAATGAFVFFFWVPHPLISRSRKLAALRPLLRVTDSEIVHGDLVVPLTAIRAISRAEVPAGQLPRNYQGPLSVGRQLIILHTAPPVTGDAAPWAGSSRAGGSLTVPLNQVTGSDELENEIRRLADRHHIRVVDTQGYADTDKFLTKVR